MKFFDFGYHLFHRHIFLVAKRGVTGKTLTSVFATSIDRHNKASETTQKIVVVSLPHYRIGSQLLLVESLEDSKHLNCTVMAWSSLSDPWTHNFLLCTPSSLFFAQTTRTQLPSNHENHLVVNDFACHDIGLCSHHYDAKDDYYSVERGTS